MFFNDFSAGDGSDDCCFGCHALPNSLHQKVEDDDDGMMMAIFFLLAGIWPEDEDYDKNDNNHDRSDNIIIFLGIWRRGAENEAGKEEQNWSPSDFWIVALSKEIQGNRR